MTNSMSISNVPEGPFDPVEINSLDGFTQFAREITNPCTVTLKLNFDFGPTRTLHRANKVLSLMGRDILIVKFVPNGDGTLEVTFAEPDKSAEIKEI